MNEREQSQVRAETAAGIKNVIQGLDGAGWVDACLKNPHITLPPGAGYLIVRHFQQVIIDTAENMAKITGFLEEKPDPVITYVEGVIKQLGG